MENKKDYTVVLITTKLGILEPQRLWMMEKLKLIVTFAMSKGLRVKLQAVGLTTEEQGRYRLDSSVWNLRLPQHCDLELVPCPRDRLYAQPLIEKMVADADEVWCFSGGRVTPYMKTRPAWVYFNYHAQYETMLTSKVKVIPPTIDVDSQTINLDKGVRKWKNNWS